MRELLLLMRKDLITAMCQPSTLIIGAVFFVSGCVISTTMLPLAFIMMVWCFVVVLFSLEENEQVCNINGVLPISRSQPVVARYLYTYLLLGASCALASVLILLSSLLGLQRAGMMQMLPLAVSGALLMASVNYPVIYKFGVVRSRIFTMILYVALVAAASASQSLLISIARDGVLTLPVYSLGLLLMAVSFAASLVSLWISVGLARRR